MKTNDKTQQFPMQAIVFESQAWCPCACPELLTPLNFSSTDRTYVLIKAESFQTPPRAHLLRKTLWISFTRSTPDWVGYPFQCLSALSTDYSISQVALKTCLCVHLPLSARIEIVSHAFLGLQIPPQCLTRRRLSTMLIRIWFLHPSQRITALT